MNLLVDGTILLDVLQSRAQHFADSAKVWKLCETEQAEGFVSALTFANLVYVLRKELSPEKTEEVLKKHALIFCFTELGTADLLKAASRHWYDFEDALQSVTAERLRADYIITLNVKDFKQSKVPALTPAELLARM